MSRGLALVAVLVVAGCGHNIGDSCQTNVDCSPLGDRFCDVAPPGGYCTVEDCGPSTCPGGSACIRFYTAIQNEPCTVVLDRPLTQANCLHTDEICVCDNSSNGTCITPTGSPFNGHCAPASTEKHWCEKLCNQNGDCRQGYECRETGTFGATPLPSFDMGGNLPIGQGYPVKFCAPTQPGNPPVNTL
jgi:hypothetical protein